MPVILNNCDFSALITRKKRDSFGPDWVGIWLFLFIFQYLNFLFTIADVKK